MKPALKAEEEVMTGLLTGRVLRHRVVVVVA